MRLGVVIAGTVAAAAMLMLVTCVVMLRPGTTVEKATANYPPRITATAVVYARLHGMPLVLDRRLRVFASRHEVWSQALTAPDGAARHWSVRRWPQHLLGIVGVVEGDAATVVAKWSDRQLIGIDARSGAVRWQREVELADYEPGYLGGPTGVYTTYGDQTLFSLHTARTRTGTPVVINLADRLIRAVDPATGTDLWSVDLTGCWTGTGFTTATTLVVIRGCQHRETAFIYDAATGSQLGTWRPEGDSRDATDWGYKLYGCVTAASECDGFDPYDQVAQRIAVSGEVVPDPHAEDGTAVGDSVIRIQGDSTAVGVDRTTGAQRWQRELGRRSWIRAVDGGSVYVETADGNVLRLDAATGVIRTQLSALVHPNDHCFHWYVTDGFLAVDCSGWSWDDRNPPDVGDDDRPVRLAGS